MRMKVFQASGERRFLLVYPSTLEHYRQAFRAPDRPAERGANRAPAPSPERSRSAQACYVVTTSAKRRQWGLPDFTGAGLVPVVDEAPALRLLDERAADPEAMHRPFRDDVAKFSAHRPRRGRTASACARRATEVAEPGAARTPVSMAAVSPDSGDGSPDGTRARLRAELPRLVSDPQWFDREHVMQVLDRTHGGLESAKARVVELLAASPQSCDLLTVESSCSSRGSTSDPRFALVVRPELDPGAARALCLAGPPGTGKTSFAASIAEALGRAHVSLSLDGGDIPLLIRGDDTAGPGRVLRNLAQARVKNPVFVLEAIDQVDEADAAVLLALLDSSRRTEFNDAFIGVSLDLSEVLWIATALDRNAIPAALRDCLEIVELPAYTDEEKLLVAEQHLLARPFDASVRLPVAALSPDSETSLASFAADPAPSSERPVVLVDRLISGPEELTAASEQLPCGNAEGEAWRTAVSSGSVRFERDAVRRLIHDHTAGAGVGELDRLLAHVCREVVRRRPAGFQGPDVVTPVVVAEVLGVSSADALPPAVRAAIAAERQRLSGSSEKTNSWIEWLEHLPWMRRNARPIDLAVVRALLDAAQAGLEHAKASVMEHLAIQRRNPAAGGAVLCLLGPPGVGKTALAQAVALALGRGFAKLACGGLRDDTELRGHNRTWRAAQPGAILRELRRVGYRDPVFVFDEIDKIGLDPAAVLLEVLDPEQQARFRDSFVELPFDLSEILFITTANDWDSIPGPLRDRLEVVRLPAYTTDEKVAIADTHLVGRENRAAGLLSTPLSFTHDALEKIVRDYTSEPGVRQLGRCLRAICRKVAVGRETGDEALIRERITAEDVSALLGADVVAGDALDPLRRQLDAAGLTETARSRSRDGLDRLSGLASDGAEYRRLSEYLWCLAALPWSASPALEVDRVQVRAKLDETHVGLAAAKDQIIDLVDMGALKESRGVAAFCIVGPPGVGKTSLARSIAAAVGGVCAQVDCQAVSNADALLGVADDRPGRIVDELRRAGAGRPVFVFDEIDRLPDKGGATAALSEVFASRSRGEFLDRYVDLPLDLSGALFIATATRVDRVPPALREQLVPVTLHGYTQAEQLAIADHHLLPVQLALHDLNSRAVRVTPDALRSVVCGYSDHPGLWPLMEALATLCGAAARRRSAGGETVVEITPAVVGEILGIPACSGTVIADGARRPGVSVGLGTDGNGVGFVSFFEVECLPGNGGLSLTGLVGDLMQESVRVGLSWLRANAEQYGLDPVFHRDTDVHLHVQPYQGVRDGVSAGAAIVAALVSAFTGRPVRGDLAMTGEITLSGDVLPVGAVKAKVLAARRRGLTRVALPAGVEKQFEGLDADLRREMTVHYLTRIDELLKVVLRPAPEPECVADGRLLPESAERLS